MRSTLQAHISKGLILDSFWRKVQKTNTKDHTHLQKIKCIYIDPSPKKTTAQRLNLAMQQGTWGPVEIVLDGNFGKHFELIRQEYNCTKIHQARQVYPHIAQQ